MSTLRNSVLKHLSATNKVLDTSKLSETNPVTIYRNVNSENCENECRNDEFHLQNELSVIQDNDPSELVQLSDLIDCSEDRPISPFSCASELLRMTPITLSNLDNISSRAASPKVYEDISSNIVRRKSELQEVLTKPKSFSTNFPCIDDQIHDSFTITAPFVLNLEEKSDENAFEDCNKTNLNVTSFQNQICTKNTSTPKHSELKSIPVAKNSHTLDDVETVEVFMIVEEESKKIENSVAEYNNIVVEEEVDKNFENSVEELIQNLSNEQDSVSKSSESKKSKKRKRKKSSHGSQDNTGNFGDNVETNNQNMSSAQESTNSSSELHINKKKKQNKANTEAQEIINDSSRVDTTSEKSRSKQNSLDSQNSSQSRQLKKNKRVRNQIRKKQLEKKKYPMLPSCNEQCIKRCGTKFTQKERRSIWKDFRNLDKQNQRNFISRNVLKHPKQISTKRVSRRHNTLNWKLKEIPVCKQFFLNTLGFKYDHTIFTVLKANFKHGIQNPLVQQAAPEQRGRSIPWNTKSQESKDNIINFINRSQPTVSHYNISHAPNRKYLPSGISFSDIYKDYLRYCADKNLQDCSWSFFHKIIKKMNLSTSNPRQDLCTVCTNHAEEHPQNDENKDETHSCAECNCKSCEVFEQHNKNKRLSRQCLDEDIKNKKRDTQIFTADMQKVILMPKLTLKDCYFSRKLVLINETFASPGKNEPAYCVVWHEGEGGRGATNVASAYINFFTKYCRDLKSAIAYVDNCAAQNQNRILFSALLRLVNSPALTNLETIKIVYLEPGHTYMAADTIHANISMKLSRSKNIYDKDDFIEKIKESRKNMNVLELTHVDMFVFTDDLKGKFPKDYNISALKVVEFRRGTTSIFLKKAYDDETFKEFSALKRSASYLDIDENQSHTLNLLEPLNRETEPRGISSAKKQDLLKLCASMPASRRIFFENLPVNDTVQDLDRDIDI
ncbi:hypothetical protein NE865_15233 [Phthorimaea operculella]|nr:hypothetical protein NE865_15233 [Phthorimaea operculella]